MAQGIQDILQKETLSVRPAGRVRQNFQAPSMINEPSCRWMHPNVRWRKPKSSSASLHLGHWQWLFFPWAKRAAIDAMTSDVDLSREHRFPPGQSLPV